MPDARNITSFDATIYALNHRSQAVRTTLNIDDALLAKAQNLTGLSGKAELVRAGLQALIERESAHRLARLGGTEPQLKPVSRRRPTKS